MMNSICKKFPWQNKSAGLLVLRIGVGVIFIFTGWMKVSDLAGTVGQFGAMGFAPFWAYLVSFVELLGGVGVLLGIGTRIAAKLLTIIMMVAIYKLWGNLPLVMTPVSVFFSTLALTLAGGGKYSLSRGFCGSHGSCGGGCGCGTGGTCPPENK
jgi:putative oxidoreductase